VQPARGVGVASRGEALGDGGGECDDVVFDLALDGVDVIDVEAGVGSQSGGGFGGDLSGFRERLA
jgi:hypothetical protein